MKCTCPKCNIKIQLDLPHVPEEGASSTCTECKSRFLVYKESFAGRALRKTGEVSCSHCGNELGPYVHCPACGVLFPDYYVAQAGLKRAPKKREAASLKESFSFSLGGGKSEASKPGHGDYTFAQQSSEKSPKSILMIISFVVLAVLLAGGISVFNAHKKERQFSSNFVQALYGIKSGTDMGLKKCQKISAEWKAKQDAGQAVIPRISAEDEADMNTVKGEIDTIMQQLNQPPKKYVTANEKLAALYGAYQKTYALTLAPSGSVQSFNDSVAKLDNDFNRAAQDLKTSLPEELKEDIRRATSRFKGLKFMTE
jgi:hypothetical protein